MPARSFEQKLPTFGNFLPPELERLGIKVPLDRFWLESDSKRWESFQVDYQGHLQHASKLPWGQRGGRGGWGGARNSPVISVQFGNLVSAKRTFSISALLTSLGGIVCTCFTSQCQSPKGYFATARNVCLAGTTNNESRIEDLSSPEPTRCLTSSIRVFGVTTSTHNINFTICGLVKMTAPCRSTPVMDMPRI